MNETNTKNQLNLLKVDFNKKQLTNTHLLTYVYAHINKDKATNAILNFVLLSLKKS